MSARVYRSFARSSKARMAAIWRYMCRAFCTSSPAASCFAAMVMTRKYIGLAAAFAGRGAPLRAVRFLLEVRARHEVGIQILRIRHHRRHDEPLVAVRRGEAIEVLGDHRVLAVRHAILSKPAAAQVIGDHFEICARRRPRLSAAATAPRSARARRTFPFSKREPLQRARRGCGT